MISCFSHSNHTGGVIAYINKQIKFTNHSVLKQDFAWFLSFDMFVNSMPITISTVYLSSSENKSIILNELEKYCDNLSDGKSVIICGDFNVDMSKNTPYSRKTDFFSTEFEFG